MEITQGIFISLLAALLAGIILLFLEHRTKWFAHFRPKSEEKLGLIGKEKSDNDHFDEAGSEYREHPDPIEILQEIRERPLAQRESAAQQYVGLLVKWRASLTDIHSPQPLGRKSDDAAALMLRFERGQVRHSGPYSAGIVCPVKIEQHPELKILKEGHELWVAGKVKQIHIDGLIYLESGARLKIDK